MIHLCLLALLTAFGLIAQNRPIFRADANLVTVPVLVTDAHGTPVRDIRPEEFRLYDNGVLPEIRQVSLQQELALVVGTLVDISASQHAFLHEHQTTVDTFLGRLLRPGDRAFIVTVNENVRLQSVPESSLICAANMFSPFTRKRVAIPNTDCMSKLCVGASLGSLSQSVLFGAGVALGAEDSRLIFLMEPCQLYRPPRLGDHRTHRHPYCEAIGLSTIETPANHWAREQHQCQSVHGLR
jgi:hypothetical protein